ncbi:hypothetical protein RJ640_028552, partial [Escallonia rubra]
MSSITVCARFRPLSSKERRDHGDGICVRALDSETFFFKDEKDEECTYSFDRVFYQGSNQRAVYEFIALPIVRDAVNGINGTIITYGQCQENTGAGKTYSMEGPSIVEGDEQKKGLLPRVVDGLFDAIKLFDEANNYTIKLSMVEIYMEKVRDLFDLSKDNIQIKEHKVQGIMVYGVTEVSLFTGIANRAVGETRILPILPNPAFCMPLSDSVLFCFESLHNKEMNMTSSRSHCIYILTVQHEVTKNNRVKTGKLILVDLAGSEKVEKTGAEGRLLEEAKTINRSLSALGNVINALTSGAQGKANHIPYRDSKLTRILQDALGGNSQTALLCCCSPSTSNASESLSTLRFGARAKHIKASPHITCKDDKLTNTHEASFLTKDNSCERILEKLRERLDAEDVKLLEELFVLEGIFFDPSSVEDLESAYEDVMLKTISSLQAVLEEHVATVKKLKRENNALKARLQDLENSEASRKE